MILICADCWSPCKAVEETFDFAGTHCTGGRSGTHHTGFYVSDCCGAEPVELRDFTITVGERTYSFGFDKKPIPDRRHDWDWWDDDDEYSGGSGESLADCLKQIKELGE